MPRLVSGPVCSPAASWSTSGTNMKSTGGTIISADWRVHLGSVTSPLLLRTLPSTMIPLWTITTTILVFGDVDDRHGDEVRSWGGFKEGMRYCNPFLRWNSLEISCEILCAFVPRLEYLF